VPNDRVRLLHVRALAGACKTRLCLGRQPGSLTSGQGLTQWAPGKESNTGSSGKGPYAALSGSTLLASPLSTMMRRTW
jgi:hypothetical protein